MKTFKLENLASHKLVRMSAIALAISALFHASTAAALTCTSEGREVLLDTLPTDAIITALNLRPAKAKAGDEGKFRLQQKDGKTLFVALTEDGKKCAIILAAATGASTVPISTAASERGDAHITTVAKEAIKAVSEEEKTAKKVDALIDKLIANGQEDLGVPSSPAISLLGVDASKATHPKTPKELAAALVQGRGADGKIKTGVAIDASLGQLLEALPFAFKKVALPTVEPKPKVPAETPVLGVPEKLTTNPSFKFTQLPKTTQTAYASKLAGNTTFSFVPSPLISSDAPAQNIDAADGDASNNFANRLKLSFATTQDSQTDKTDKNATDIAFGVHYVFFDQSDSISSNCDGENHKIPAVQDEVKKLIAKKFAPVPKGKVTPNQLRALRNNKYPGIKDQISTDDIEPVLAACSLTAMERLEASAAMIGIANSYKITEGGWSQRQSGVRGIAATYVSNGIRFIDNTVLQGIGHFRATRHQIVADPADSTKKVFQDSNLASLRLRMAGLRGAGSLEFSRSKNTTDGKSETVTRRALGLEWQLSPGIWLVGSGGSEKSSLGNSSSKPFVITNLRFGGSPPVPAATP